MRYGHYDLELRLGAGGMAEVFLGRPQPRSGRLGGRTGAVAVKRILPHLSARHEYVQMFLDEARITAIIDHPNVAHIYDYGAADGLYYIAMEFVLGETLFDIIERAHKTAPIAPEAAATVLIALCQGLHAAHELRGPDGRLLGVVHRDVTPSNIIVRYDGTLKIVDFGVAQANLLPRGARQGGLFGSRNGKPAYMSPRMTRGREVDRRADIWSLGVCAWELLTGRRLFQRSNEVAVMRAVVEEDIPRPEAVRPDLPKPLCDIVMRALSRDRCDRFSTCARMQRALEAFLEESDTRPSKIMLSRYVRDIFGEGHIRKREQLISSDFAQAERTAPLIYRPVGTSSGALVKAPRTMPLRRPFM